MIFRFVLALLFCNYFTNASEISFTNDIKPILDKRCVVCHSCYNSPCQTKFSSFEGIQRGGTKTAIYDNRIKVIEPTRLFIDATNESTWREKGFYSILDSLDNQNNSLMSILLEQKQKYPQSIGNYAPENDKLTCSKDLDEIQNFIKEKPNHGMPYGFPPLLKNEHQLLIKWLQNKAPNDSNKFIKSEKLPKDLKAFEKFLNQSDIKHQVTARYIYEHLYLAHIKFDDSKDFYKLIRSYDKDGKEPVKTRLPYGDPYTITNKKFYYKLQKITSTIVHKTHMVYYFNKEKLKRYETLFIKSTWRQPPKLISYDNSIAANPLTAYTQIPLESRYKFLLDDVHFFIKTFIRGPVCKGQIALNVIHDHFWIAFKEPKYDATIQDRNFISKNQSLLALPNENGSNTTFMESLDFLKYDNDTVSYYQNKNKLYENKNYPLNLQSIWRGNNPNGKNNDAILTIYRHFDSASVHKGALGNTPRTMWVIDYPLLERLYYSLVAGFDVFGNTQHKVMVRKYMDRLRIEGESNFLEYLPKEQRQSIFNSWYDGLLAKYFVTYTPSQNNTNIKFTNTDASIKNDLINQILKHTNTPKNKINSTQKFYKANVNFSKNITKEQIEEHLKDFSIFDNVKKFKEFSSTNFNLFYIRFKMQKKDFVYSIVLNRWHNNVAFMFIEDERLDIKKDSIDIIEGFVGSYPNYFIVVDEKDIPQFFNTLRNYDFDEANLKKYFIARNDPKFWENYDWFQNRFNQEQPMESGLFDLNRYYHKSFLYND